MTAIRTNRQGPGRRYRFAASMGRIFVGAFVLAVLLFTLIPIVLALLGSLKTNTELTVGATFLPKRWDFSTYARAWNEAHFAIFTWNSIYVSVLSSIGTVAVASMAAYAVGRVAFAGKRLFVAVQTGTMFVALGAITLRPQFDIMVGLHLNTSLAAVIILNISNHAFAFLILLGFMKGGLLDRSEEERRPYVFSELDNRAMVREERYKYIFYSSGEKELYDLDSDPHEMINLAYRESSRDVVDRLHQALALHMMETRNVHTKFNRKVAYAKRLELEEAYRLSLQAKQA
ncbi:carbohydrate ABC transporter permease [Paenibacillus cymbidii]|uniref:carbohydrate ABC transporter permease n=1 Tax=Paenibacillus cymbidii TaxID=1639034 RepID=UPI001081D159|nr:sulfatase/phosphatase domain-containing protein [Paenibacillus cymbidii]